MIGLCLAILAAFAGTDPASSIDSVRLGAEAPAWMARPLDSLRGSPLTESVVRSALEEAVVRAESRGFLLARASADSLDSAGILHLGAQAGRRFVWGGVRDRGTSRLRPDVLTRLSRIGSGVDADPRRMESARSRILSSGYVEEASEPTIAQIPRTSAVRMVVDLRDLPSSYVEGAGGWSQGEDASGAVDIHLADIAGTARDLSFGISQGGASLRANGTWKEPWIGPFDVAAIAHGELDQDSLSRRWSLSCDLEWSLADGLAELRTGMATSRSAEVTPGDSLFGPEVVEWSSRLGGGWRSAPPVPWPTHEAKVVLGLEAALLSSDTGRSGRLRASGEADMRRSLGPAVLRLGGRGRTVWPLDKSVGSAESRAIGGIQLWRGWPEGSPRTPSWAQGITEVGIGNHRSGGVGAFFEPGTMARRNLDLTWSAVQAWSAGTFATLLLPRWQVDLVISVRDDTPRWNEALLSVRAINRF
ncbi:MAG: hypothetical protein IPK50_20485 [Fibrobacterota bacterium]|nr:hypothetical protein [Fibrobacterota bacterium]QQS04633.1 MAG: hypothetical protein IPK50_20485 [Fibrobacterota bacterium]